VFASEIDKFANKTYQANFETDSHLLGDITTFPEEDIPNHDVLLAGFPCQPFSLAGLANKNFHKRAHGFRCNKQGTLFFDIARIIAEKRPKAFVLENVKNLVSHNAGRTFKVMMQILEHDLEYQVYYKVINAKYWVLQNRERLIIIGFREPVDFSWGDIVIPDSRRTMSDILLPEHEVDPKYTLTDRMWAWLLEHKARQAAKGNRFTHGLVDANSLYTRTLTAHYSSEILVTQRNGANPRKLTPRECARLMGFDDDFIIPVSDTQAYRQFGNSVVIPMVKAIAEAVRPHIEAME